MLESDSFPLQKYYKYPKITTISQEFLQKTLIYLHNSEKSCKFAVRNGSAHESTSISKT